MLVSVRGRFHVNGRTDLDAATDQVMDALLQIESSDTTISDSDVSAELEDRIVTITVIVDANTWDEGNERGRVAIRSAIEAANGQVTDPPEVSTETESFRFVTQAESSELIPA